MSRNAFYRMKNSQMGHKWIGKRSESGRNWSELVGIDRKIEEFPLNSDAARRAARRGAQHPRQCSRTIILCCLHTFVFKKVSRANILFAMMNNPQTLLPASSESIGKRSETFKFTIGSKDDLEREM